MGKEMVKDRGDVIVRKKKGEKEAENGKERENEGMR